MPIIIKLVRANDIRRLSYDTTPAIATLRDTAFELLQCARDAPLRYLDADGDTVTLAADSDLFEAFAQLPAGQALRVLVGDAAPVPVPAAAPDQTRSAAESNSTAELPQAAEAPSRDRSTEPEQPKPAEPAHPAAHLFNSLPEPVRAMLASVGVQPDNLDAMLGQLGLAVEDIDFDACEAWLHNGPCATACQAAQQAAAAFAASGFFASGSAGPSSSSASASAATPAASGPVLHRGVTCDGCGTQPIAGSRFKCSVCPDFDFCETCEAAVENTQHVSDHAFVKIRTPASARHPHGARAVPLPSPHMRHFFGGRGCATGRHGGGGVSVQVPIHFGSGAAAAQPSTGSSSSSSSACDRAASPAPAPATPVATPTAASPTATPEVAAQPVPAPDTEVQMLVEQLAAMGFTDEDRNRALLRVFHGNMDRVLAHLLN